MKDIGSEFLDAYSWIRLNDLPNWLTIVFTGIFWPLVLFIWTRRKVRNVPNLAVSLSQCKLTMDNKDYDGVNLKFLNNTGSIVYITNVRPLRCSSLFPVHPDASRDIADRSHELKFFDDLCQKYCRRQITLQTNEEAVTCIAISNLDKGLLLFKSSWFRILLRMRKYFHLQYVALVGNQKYRVSTAY